MFLPFFVPVKSSDLVKPFGKMKLEIGFSQPSVKSMEGISSSERCEANLKDFRGFESLNNEKKVASEGGKRKMTESEGQEGYDC